MEVLKVHGFDYLYTHRLPVPGGWLYAVSGRGVVFVPEPETKAPPGDVPPAVAVRKV